MAKGQVKKNKETKKPKAEKPKPTGKGIPDTSPKK